MNRSLMRMMMRMESHLTSMRKTDWEEMETRRKAVKVVISSSSCSSYRMRMMI